MKKLILLLLLAGVANAQSLSPFYKTAAASQSVVVIDSTYPSGGYGGNWDFSHTVSTGTGNRVLAVFWGNQDARPQPDSMKYGGESLTLISGLAGDAAVSFWYLVDPPTGSNTLNIYQDADMHRGVVVLTLANVDQSTPFENSTRNGGFPPENGRDSVTITTTSGRMILGATSAAGQSATSLLIDASTGDAFWKSVTSSSGTSWGLMTARFQANDASAIMKVYNGVTYGWMQSYAVQVKPAP